MPSSALPILPGYLARSDGPLSEQQLAEIVAATVPPYAYHVGREWTWTRPGGVWKLNLVLHEVGERASLKARLDGSPLSVTVRTSRREVNAAIRWLVLVDAIDRHPDDPQPAAE